MNTLLRACPAKKIIKKMVLYIFIIYPLERYPLTHVMAATFFAIACYLVWTPHNIILTHNHYRLIAAMDHLCSIVWTTDNIYWEVAVLQYYTVPVLLNIWLHKSGGITQESWEQITFWMLVFYMTLNILALDRLSEIPLKRVVPAPDKRLYCP